MSKVIFEFNEEEDRIEIENIMKRNDFKYALEKVKEYRRRLYKGDMNKEIIVKDKKVIAEGNEILNLDGNITGRKAYIAVSDVIDELDDCLNTVIVLLDKKKIEFLLRDRY